MSHDMPTIPDIARHMTQPTIAGMPDMPDHQGSNTQQSAWRMAWRHGPFPDGFPAPQASRQGLLAYYYVGTRHPLPSRPNHGEAVVKMALSTIVARSAE